ncbi:amidohydrolase [Bosea sp. BIWAKO-01]|uniref:amidohydrolase n=1 Tax=Bosea sp. BIWAKO-01 TaxID=506668 RepID=UPI0008537438|nr:amidohydrolase [Bosea sp. BIWAKO-01]GAU85769.1 N-acetyl-L,L-diaminopimelate deacetylase [Bosea sp. BIWAKO-01]
MDQAFLDQLTQWRRQLHAQPELSEHEHATSRFVQEKLTELGIPFVAGVGGTGVVATLSRPGSNRTVGLRADMDALPIQELNTAAYASQTQGAMHACGHDGHTVALLGTAAMLAADEGWKGQVQFIFQPAEENGVGAKAMIQDGLFERFPMERVFSFHNWPGLEAGTIAVHDGPVMAAGGRWSVTLHGLAGHAAIPHQTRDPIVAAGHLIVALQTIVARNVDPVDAVVLSIGQISGGVVSNQIPESVTLLGTLRTYRPEVREAVIKRMESIIAGICEAYGMQADVEILSTGRPIINTPAEAALSVQAGQAIGAPVRRDVRPSTTGDDFSFLIKERPGAYVWIGNGPAGPEGELHNARYDFNDAILPVCVGWMSEVARRALADAA